MRGRLRGGFTLTELLVVMGIILVLTASAVPALSAFRSGQRLDHAARVVASVLADARRLAITKHARHVVVFYSYEEIQGELDTVRHAIRIYQEPTGLKPGTAGVPANVTAGYFPGGYQGDPVILPANVRFLQDKMECRVLPQLPEESSEFFRRRLRGEQTDALAYRRDGTVEDRRDAPATDTTGRSIFLPDEGCFQVPDSLRADIVIVETDNSGRELTPKGKKRRALVDIVPATGRASGRVFDVGGTAPEFMPTAGQSGTGGL